MQSDGTTFFRVKIKVYEGHIYYMFALEDLLETTIVVKKLFTEDGFKAHRLLDNSWLEVMYSNV